jgi:capsular polysaccharide biosynthesis protein
MEIQQYLRTLRENWWIVVAALLTCLAVGIFYSYAQTPQYEATATFTANPSVRIANTDDQVQVFDTLARRSGVVSSYCLILKSGARRAEAIAALGIPPEMVEDYELDCVVLPDSSILALTVQGTSPYLATDLTNALGIAGLNYITELQEIFELRPLDPAKVNPDPISPNHLIDLALAGILGLMGGVGFVFLREAIQKPFAITSRDAITDPTAGTASMGYLRQRLEEEISRAKLQNYPLNLAVIRFDALEELNQFPDQAMRQLRRQLAVFLQDGTRPLDLVAYVRDNTFSILMPEVNGMEARDRMVDLLSDLRLKVFNVPDLGVSVAFQGVAGIVENSAGDVDWRTMMAMGQEAVENAGNQGPYQVHLKRTTPGPFFDVLVGAGN